MQRIFSLLFFGLSLLTARSQNDLLIPPCKHYKGLSLAEKTFQQHIVQAANERSDTIDILKYTINLDITDFSAPDTIRGNCVVRFAPKMNNITTISLDLLSMTIDSIRIGTTALTSSYNDTLLIINLPMTYNIGDTSDMVVYYRGEPQTDPSGWGGWYNQSGYAFNLGVGFQADPHNFGRAWFPCFDNFVERSRYEFNITTSNGKLAYCNGYLAGDTTVNGLRTRKWILDEEIPTYLASVAVAAYTQVNWVHNGINDTFPIVLTALPADTTNMKNSFVNLNNGLTAFENRYGPYIWNRVGYCLVPFNSGAMEHATNIAYPRVAANGSLTYEANLMAHELSHHWWGDLVTCETAGDMWINEGMATYSQFIFSEWVYGYNAYLAAVRANHDDMVHYAHLRENGFRAISGVPHQYTYGDHVYLKGADVAHTLRGYLGDSLFFLGLNYFLYNNTFTDVNSASMMADMTTATGFNLGNFLNDWVLNPGWPHFSVDSFVSVPNGNNFDVTVYVRQRLYGAPNYFTGVPLDITFKDGAWNTETRSLSMSGQLMSFTFTLPINPVFAALDVSDRISDAITSDARIVTATGNSFSQSLQGRMQLKVLGMASGDSAYVRIEQNWVKPDGFKSWGVPYRLSSKHYWKVDGLLPAGFYAQGVIAYDGRTTITSGGQGQMDTDLLTANNLEDSIALFYRQGPADDWILYPYYTKTMGAMTDRFGTITIDSLRLGEYTLGIRDYTMTAAHPDMPNTLSLYPNPSSGRVTVHYGATEETRIIVRDMSGRIIHTQNSSGSGSAEIDCTMWQNGIYLIAVENKGIVTGRTKFAVVH
ncbi:MAG: M1 family aminopeptidase [Bacteroidota bacterium]